MKKILLLAITALYIGGIANAQLPGELDLLFGGTGKYYFPYGDSSISNGVVIQGNNKVVFSGAMLNPGSGYDVVVGRLIDGVLDFSFGPTGAGYCYDSYIGTDEHEAVVAIAPDGRLVTSSWDQVGTPTGHAIFEFKSFTDNGILEGTGNIDLGVNSSDIAQDLAFNQTDAHWAQVGFSYINYPDTNQVVMSVVYWRPIGPGLGPETGFDGDGRKWIFLQPYKYYYATATVIQPDGKILVAGYGLQGPSPAYNSAVVVVRLNTDGSFDSSFGGGAGWVQYDLVPGFTGLKTIHDMALQPDGKIVLAGSIDNTTRDFLVVRLEPDGDLDPAFGSAGVGMVSIDFIVQGESTEDNGRAVGIGKWGHVYVGGYNGDFELACLEPNGLLSTSFGINGKTTTNMGGDDHVHALAIDSLERIVLAGDISISAICLARYNGQISVATRELATPVALQVYPNPLVQREFCLEMELPEDQEAQLRLINMEGQLVSVLDDTRWPAGAQRRCYRLPIYLPSGIYALQLKSLRYTGVVTMIVE